MTLKELLDLKLIRDNARILVFKKYPTGLGDYEYEYNITHIMGNLLTENALLKKGVESEMFNYNVKEILGDKDKFKICIVIEK